MRFTRRPAWRSVRLDLWMRLHLQARWWKGGETNDPRYWKTLIEEARLEERMKEDTYEELCLPALVIEG